MYLSGISQGGREIEFSGFGNFNSLNMTYKTNGTSKGTDANNNFPQINAARAVEGFSYALSRECSVGRSEKPEELHQKCQIIFIETDSAVLCRCSLGMEAPENCSCKHFCWLLVPRSPFPLRLLPRVGPIQLIVFILTPHCSFESHRRLERKCRRCVFAWSTFKWS